MYHPRSNQDLQYCQGFRWQRQISEFQNCLRKINDFDVIQSIKWHFNLQDQSEVYGKIKEAIKAC